MSKSIRRCFLQQPHARRRRRRLPLKTNPPTVPPPAATKPVSDLKITLMDGSILQGKISVPELTVDTKFGTLKVPLDQIQSFAPGLQSHTQFSQTLQGLINDLASDAFADREKAQAAIVKLGPSVKPELERPAQNFGK